MRNLEPKLKCLKFSISVKIQTFLWIFIHFSLSKPSEKISVRSANHQRVLILTDSNFQKMNLKNLDVSHFVIQNLSHRIGNCFSELNSQCDESTRKILWEFTIHSINIFYNISRYWRFNAYSRRRSYPFSFFTARPCSCSCKAFLHLYPRLSEFIDNYFS